MAKTCKAIDLLYLAERYEYRVMATSVMDHILFEADLSDGARTLWLILFRGAALNEGVRCEASVSFLKNKTGRSEATLWRQIRELRSLGYLEVETRKGLEGESLPNIYGPRLPATIVAVIKQTAIPREVVSKQIADHEYAATTRDYEKAYNTIQPSPEPQQPDHPEALATAQEQKSQITEGLACTDAPRAACTGRDAKASVSGHKGGFTGSQYETGGDLKTETENTNTSPKESYTTTGTGHSRDKWKCYPHIRLQVLERLSKMGIETKRAKVLMSEIDWTLKFGSMEWWNVKKGINVCLKLIREGRWKTPRWSV
jgi:hypothetical protein